MKISFSKVKTWRHCHKQYDYKYNQRLRRKAKALPLFRGSILGEMLDARALKLMGKPTVTPEGILKRYEKEHKQLFTEEREMYGDIIGDCRRIFETYERYHQNDSLKYLSVEEELSLDLGDGVTFIGYIDKRVLDTKRKLKFILDHKSHKVIPTEDDRFSDLQLVFYFWAYNKLNPKAPVDGVIWDYVRTKPPVIPEQLKNGQLTQRANIDTDAFTYGKEIARLKLNAADYRDILETLQRKSTDFVQRVYLPAPSKTLVTSVVDDLISSAKQIQELGETVRDRNMGRACSFCEFKGLCQAEVRGLDSDYIRKVDFTIEEETRDAEESTED